MVPSSMSCQVYPKDYGHWWIPRASMTQGFGSSCWEERLIEHLYVYWNSLRGNAMHAFYHANLCVQWSEMGA